MKRTLFFVGIIWLALTGGVVPVVTAATPVTRQEALSFFVKANFAYKDGRYDEAVNLYERILQGGLDSGALYYNLANSYYKKGHLGYAILNYERALRLLPRDADVRVNYRYALSQVSALYRLPVPSFAERVIEQYTGVFTQDEIAVILLVLALLAAAGHLLSFFCVWPRSRLAAFYAVILVLFGAFLTAFVIRGENNRDLGFVVQATASRFEPNAKATVHFDLTEGEKVRVEKKEGEWLKIERLDGKIGWVPAGSVVKI